MPFIGQQPLTGAYSKLDSITTSATATYNLQLDSAAYSPASANHLLVSLNGVMQAPQDSFTVSGSTITFASALTSSDNIDFIMAMGDVLNIGTPSDGTVTTAKIAASAVTDAKIAASAVTDVKIASGISSSKLTGALPALDGSALTGTDATTVYDQFRLTSNRSGDGDITANIERVDDASIASNSSSQVSESSGVFSFPETGIYLVVFVYKMLCGNNDNIVGRIMVTINNSSYDDVAQSNCSGPSGLDQTGGCTTLIDVTDTSNVKVKFNMTSVGSGSNLIGSTDTSQTAFTFIKIANT